jgi:nitroreductase
MNFSDLAMKRTSIRGYRDKPVSERALNRILETARHAPSAANKQPWHVLVVRDEAQRARLGEAYAKEWFHKAPVILVVCTVPEQSWSRADGKNYADVDGAIFMDHVTLCAADQGLGTCWIGAFNAQVVREVLELPAGIEPLAMTPLGEPDDQGRPKKRKELEEFVHYERW